MPRWMARSVVAGLAAVLVAVPAAQAEDRRIVVDQPPYQVLGSLRAGESLVWRVGTHVEGVESASLDLQLRTWGALVEHAEGLLIQVDVCEQHEAVCDRRIIDRAPLREVATQTASDTWYVTNLHGEAPAYLDVELSLPTSATAVSGLEGSVAVGLFASSDDEDPGDDPGDDPGEEPGEDPDEGPDEEPDEGPGDDPDDGTPDDDLPLTGVALGSLLALAAGLGLLGSVLRTVGRRNR